MSDREPKRLARREVHDGRVIRMSVDTVALPDGSTREMDVVRHPGASAILPVVGRLDDPDPEVLLIRQFRYAVGAWLYEVPAGTRREGEPFEQVALRELEEETGWKAGRLVPLTHVWTTPGFTDEVIHLWLACDLQPGTSDPDDDEVIDVVRVPLSTALAWIREGRIVDGKSLATLLYAARFVLPPPA